MMPSQPYYRIWRPGCSESCSCDRRNAADIQELCADYAALENRFRRALHKYPELYREDAVPSSKLAKLLQLITFEVQHNLFGLLKANGVKPQLKEIAGDFRLANKALRLDEYTAKLRLFKTDHLLQPFEDLDKKPPVWYLAKANPLRPANADAKSATLQNTAQALAGLRCLLYAQFGTLPDSLITATSRKTGEGLFTATSLLSVTPAPWPESEQYLFDWDAVKKQKKPFARYPFSDRT